MILAWGYQIRVHLTVEYDVCCSPKSARYNNGGCFQNHSEVSSDYTHLKLVGWWSVTVWKLKSIAQRILKKKYKCTRLALGGSFQKMSTRVHTLHTYNIIRVMIGVGTSERLENIEVVELQHGWRRGYVIIISMKNLKIIIAVKSGADVRHNTINVYFW